MEHWLEPSMSDFSEAEILTLEQTFPGVTVFGCNFHREQAWICNHKNGLNANEQDKLLSLLQDCVWANSGGELGWEYHYKQAVEKLQDYSVEESC